MPLDAVLLLDTPQSAPVTRKLHFGHFAFLRCLAEGLDITTSWSRYLRVEGERSDVRLVKRTIAWLRDEMAAAAKRHNQPRMARLVSLQIVLEKAPAAPSLDDFIIERGMEDFSEAEQMEAYQEQYGTATQRQTRHANLLVKQLDALRDLERLVAEPPRADDGVGAWLNPVLAKRLETAGMVTLRQLIERINGTGRGWYRSIPAIGAGKAERVIEWLDTHEATIRLSIGKHARNSPADTKLAEWQAIVPRATAIVPFEKFIVPVALSGVEGRFRAPAGQCALTANNDYEVILAFISEKRGLPAEQIATLKRQRGIDPVAPAAPLDWLQYLSHTQRAYFKELERFLLWAVIANQKPLSSMTFEDCLAYRAFLADPQPSEVWCGARGRERWGPAWRPFEGPLQASAIRQAITILKSFYKFLNDQRYLTVNPWAGITKPRPEHEDLNTARSFTHAQWDFIDGQLDELPVTSANLRMRFALRLLYGTGMRRSELLAARVGDMHWSSYPPVRPGEQLVEGWELHVTGKGDKRRKVPVSPALADDLAAYLVSRGLSPDLRCPENRDVYLLGRAVDVAERAHWSPAARQAPDLYAGISVSTFNTALKTFFKHCARALQDSDAAGAAHIIKASAHWLRHTRISHSIAAGTDLDVERSIVGHASLATTSKYTHVEDRRRLQGSAKFWEASQKQTVAPVPAAPVATTPQLDSGEQSIVMSLCLEIENNSQFVRGKKKARRDIENLYLSDFNYRRIDDSNYQLIFTFDDEDDLAQQIDELISQIAITAEDRFCFIDELELHDPLTGRYWS